MRASVTSGHRTRAGLSSLVSSDFEPAMLRIHGDRSSLLAALTAHWAEQQRQIPQPLSPAPGSIRRRPRPPQPSGL
jgi:hypothetical protein